MLLKLCYYDNPILRTQCKPIQEITDEIRQLAADMIETMDAHNGIGLASPQVGKSLCMFVMRQDEYDEENNLILGEPLIFINPKLSNPGKNEIILPEGCLSIPGLHIDVARPDTIFVQALDLEGNQVEKEFTDYTARVIMHENDHLNGVLFVDRISTESKTNIQPILKQIKEKFLKIK